LVVDLAPLSAPFGGRSEPLEFPTFNDQGPPGRASPTGARF